MALTTYAQLQTAILDFLDRPDLTAAAPTFIALAETQLARDVRHWRMIERATATFTGRYTALPSDWVETIRLTVADAPLTLMSWAEMARRRDAAADVTGTPVYYAHLGEEIEVWPTPDADATGELTYYQTIPALSDDVTTNWLLTAAPDAYLYGSLIHSAGYLKDDGRAQTWAGLYAAAVARLNAASDAAKHSGSPLKLRPVK